LPPVHIYVSYPELAWWLPISGVWCLQLIQKLFRRCLLVIGSAYDSFPCRPNATPSRADIYTKIHISPLLPPHASFIADTETISLLIGLILNRWGVTRRVLDLPRHVQFNWFSYTLFEYLFPSYTRKSLHAVVIPSLVVPLSLVRASIHPNSNFSELLFLEMLYIFTPPVFLTFYLNDGELSRSIAYPPYPLPQAPVLLSL